MQDNFKDPHQQRTQLRLMENGWEINLRWTQIFATPSYVNQQLPHSGGNSVWVQSNICGTSLNGARLICTPFSVFKAETEVERYSLKSKIQWEERKGLAKTETQFTTKIRTSRSKHESKAARCEQVIIFSLRSTVGFALFCIRLMDFCQSEDCSWR